MVRGETASAVTAKKAGMQNEEHNSAKFCLSLNPSHNLIEGRILQSLANQVETFFSSKKIEHRR